MKNKTYDILKRVALIILPAIATFYGSIGKIWGLPCTEQIVLTITALDTLIGTILGVSNAKYNKESK